MTGERVDHTEVVAAVAVAMLRYVLADKPSELELRAVDCGRGLWLHLSYPAWEGGKVRTPGVASELVRIDSLAVRWGHRADSELQTLWALLR